MGPVKRTSLLEEYFYACLVVLFAAVSILLIAGGFGTFNSLVAGAWVAVAVWFGKQFVGYVKEKEKTVKAKAAAAAAAAPKPAEPPNGKVALPPGMKPMIGPQWPVKSGAFPTRPGLRTFPSVPKTADHAPSAPRPAAPAPATPVSTVPGPAAPGNANKSGFVYERPTLPDRKPKLPRNWQGQEPKKPRR
jgi:hypothetical protein